MPDDPRDDYLADLDRQLPMPPERRAEILEEIRAHLEDAVDAGLTEGAAQARLGSPRDLAGELARPQQSTWRVFAGVGAGLRTGVAQWVYGYLLGSVLVLVGTFVLVAAVQVAGSFLGTGWRLEFSNQGWSTLLTALSATLGLYFAGRAMPESVSLRSVRLQDDVRPWVVIVGAGALFYAFVFGIHVPHNWASAVAFSLAPAAFALGAYRPGLLPRRVRFSYLVIIGLFLTIPLAGLLTASAGASGSTDHPVPASTLTDGGRSIIGPLWTDERHIDGVLFSSMSRDPSRDGEQPKRYEWVLAEGVRLAGLSDLRIEAWRSNDDRPWELDTRHRGPFVTARAIRNGGTISASLATHREPDVTHWELVLTGIGPDGRRYVLDSGGGSTTTFTGSAWDWFVAVIDR